MISQFREPRTIPFADAFPLPSPAWYTSRSHFAVHSLYRGYFFFLFTPHRNSSSIDAASIFLALSSDRDWSRRPYYATTDSAITYRTLIHTHCGRAIIRDTFSTLSTFLDMQRPLKTPRTERYFFLLSRPHYLLHPLHPARLFIRRRWIPMILPGFEINQLSEFLSWSVIRSKGNFSPCSRRTRCLVMARWDIFTNLMSIFQRKCPDNCSGENYFMKFSLKNGEVEHKLAYIHLFLHQKNIIPTTLSRLINFGIEIYVYSTDNIWKRSLRK